MAQPTTSNLPPPFEAQVDEALEWGDFEALDRLFAEARRDRNKNVDGRDKMLEFNLRLGLPTQFEVGLSYAENWVALAESWAKTYPDRPLAHLMVASNWLDRGWQIRGSGVARDVSPQAWLELRRSAAKARAHLEKHQQLLEPFSTTHNVWLRIALLEGWPPDAVLRQLVKGLNADPLDQSLFFSALTTTLPQWGGDAARVDRLVQAALTHTEAQLGHELYSRLYARAAFDHFGRRIFTDSRARWPLMKKGYQQILKRYPSLRFRNQYAAFACIAKDRGGFDEALASLESLGQELDPDQWSMLGGLPFMDSCLAWRHSS